MAQSYVLYSFTGSDETSTDLSPFFLTPGIADPSLKNATWNLSISDEQGALRFAPVWNGTVHSDGSLNQGDAPPDFTHSGTTSCNNYLLLQVTFEPDPDKRCDSPNDQPCDCPSSDPSGQQSCSASPSTCGSVELATGRFVFDQPLLSVSGLGSGTWNFGLNYKSNYSIDGILGKNFAYPQYMHIQPLGSAEWPFYNVQLVTNQLSRSIFINNLDGTFSPTSGNSSGGRLTVINEATVDERFILVTPDGTTTTFFGFDYEYQNVSQPAPGQIESIVDRYGNEQSFTWGAANNGTPQLLTATDSYGRTASYSYYGSEGGYRLKRLTDYLGRQVDFQYDSYGHLVAVVTPSILKGAPGNTFPGGTAYAFQYDVGNADRMRRDDLLRIWYPNQTLPYLDVDTRTVDVASVYAEAKPRYQITYGQSLGDLNSYGKVLTETLGDPENGVGGTASFAYVTDDLPENLIDPSEAGTIVSRTVYTDRNGNRTLYDFNATWTVSRMEVQLNRNKNSLEIAEADAFVTWTKYNDQCQPLVTVYPEGNSTEYIYEDGDIAGLPSSYIARRGLLLSENRRPGNDVGLPSREGSNGQTILTKRYFYEPLFTRLCASIDERGNPIDDEGTYFTPQNGGATPTDADRSRYATIHTFDYQKDTLTTVKGDTALQSLLGLTATQIQTLIEYVDDQMKATDGTGGIPSGFPLDLGDINGDGTGNGASSGLSHATHLGNLIKTTHPSVLLVGGTVQDREEIFTVNLRGQITTATDPEGNLTVTTRYPENDPEGDGRFISATASSQQYGLVKEIHRDANPDDVMSLVGASGDLVDFVPGLITRTNTPGVYLDLVTRYEGSSGCMSCSYDPMGNLLNETDPRGFTTSYDRNEVGRIYRVTGPAPYSFKVETSYDANGNAIQVDTEDQQVQFTSSDPTSADYGRFTPSGSGTTAHAPMVPGSGGALRPGWFSNLMSFDLLDNKIEQDIDATGSTPSHLVTRFQYDPNNNLAKITKPEGNTVEYDYDERNLKIFERVGYDEVAGQPGALTGYSYDGNRNLVNTVGPVDHTAGIPGAATSQSLYVADAFGSGHVVGVIGDWTNENTYDGFNRVVQTTDAIGNVGLLTYDPTSLLVQEQHEGPIDGGSPINRLGTHNVLLSNRITRLDEALRTYEVQQDVFLAEGVELGSGRTVTHTGGGLAANSTANDHTATVTLTSDESSYVLARTIYDRSGRIIALVSDNTAQTSLAYDGAGRQILSTDPLNNSVSTEYDGNGNPTRSIRTEICTITTPSVENEIFESFSLFDCLNRAIVTGYQGADAELTTDLTLCCTWQGLPSTLFSVLGFDSRNNKTVAIDPKLNTIVSIFDGASRLVETHQLMKQYGDGRKAPAPNQTLSSPRGIIRTEYVLDANGRPAQLVDDRGASTTYVYDSLDRPVTRILADGSVSTREYDLANCLLVYTDENGSTVTATFDAMSRKIDEELVGSTGTGGDNYQAFWYDGLSRIEFAEAGQHGDSDICYFAHVYDSLSRLIEQGQGKAILYYNTRIAWVSFSATEMAYPDNITTVTTGYDALYRKTSLTALSDSTTLDTVAWEYFGQARVAEANYASGSLIVSHMDNSRTHSSVQPGVPLPPWGDISSDRLGYDGCGRMITKRYLTGGIDGTTHGYNSATSLAGFTAAYDRASNKLYERHLHAETRSHLYQPFNNDGSPTIGYDSANRLNQYQRGVLSSSSIPYRVNPGSSVSTPITLPGTCQIRNYNLDGLGNWRKTEFVLVDSEEGENSFSQTRQHNYVNELMSSRTEGDDTTERVTFSYAHGNNTDGQRGNGTLANDGTLKYFWDTLGRLIAIKDANTDETIAVYEYDARNRRVTKNIYDLGGGYGGITRDIPAGTTVYFYDGDQVIQEQYLSFSEPSWGKTCFWGLYIDELMFFAQPDLSAYRVLSDLMYRSVALVTTDNEIVEAYDTDAYGNTICYSAPGTDENWFSDDSFITNNPQNTTIFTGRLYDPESTLYYYRARYYSCKIGRFVSRDPLGYRAGMNLYTYASSSPQNRKDPSGLCDIGKLQDIEYKIVATPGGQGSPTADNIKTAIKQGMKKIGEEQVGDIAESVLTAAIMAFTQSWGGYAIVKAKCCVPCKGGTKLVDLDPINDTVMDYSTSGQGGAGPLTSYSWNNQGDGKRWADDVRSTLQSIIDSLKSDCATKSGV